MNEGTDLKEDSLETKKEEARGYILSLIQQASVLGGNDTEFGDMNALIEQMQIDEITPEKAKRDAYEIYERKNPYH